MLYILIYILFFNFYSKDLNYSNLEQSIEKHFKGYDKKNYAYYFYDLDNGKVVLKHNIYKSLPLASVSKLFITGASLELLGADYRFKTKVYIDSEDNLYIKGGGDPCFVSESMWYLVNKLHSMGYRKFNNIYLDNTLFKEHNYEYINNDRAYSAIVSPLLVNFNSIAVNVKSGTPWNVSIDPNIMKLRDFTKKDIKKTRVQIRRKNDFISVNGNINVNDYGFITKYRNIDNPVDNFAKTLKLHLTWRGIEVLNSIMKSKLVKSANFLFEVDSKRLLHLLTDMNRFSNNLIAEELLLALSTKNDINPEYKFALKRFNEYLKKSSSKKSLFKLVNASGLTKKNRANLEFLINYLKNIYFNKDIVFDFISSLSISGIDGTIKNTMRSDLLRGKIRAKTGTLNNVRTIAGFFNKENKYYAFGILINDNGANNFYAKEKHIFKEFY